MMFEKNRGEADVEMLRHIIERGTKHADDMISIHQKLIAKADELLAKYPGIAGYLKQKEDSQKALVDDYRFKPFLERSVAKAKEMLETFRHVTLEGT
jgi:hypothetical protein